MSDPFASLHRMIFDTFGVPAQVRRGADAPRPLRVVVRDGVERLGEYQQVIGRARHVQARSPEWVFQRGDRLTLEDGTLAVEALVSNDGHVNEAVLHGG